MGSASVLKARFAEDLDFTGREGPAGFSQLQFPISLADTSTSQRCPCSSRALPWRRVSPLQAGRGQEMSRRGRCSGAALIPKAAPEARAPEYLRPRGDLAMPGGWGSGARARAGASGPVLNVAGSASRVVPAVPRPFRRALFPRPRPPCPWPDEPGVCTAQCGTGQAQDCVCVCLERTRTWPLHCEARGLQFGERTRDCSPGHAGKEGPQLARTGVFSLERGPGTALQAMQE